MTPSTVLGQRFDEALLLANELHREQRRKGGDVPYLAHLLAVTSLVLEHGGDEDEAIAAMLHDAVEDQGGEATARLMEARLGARVRAIVEGCSDAMGSPKPPWAERKETFIAALPAQSASVALVVAADKLHNLRSVTAEYRAQGPIIWERFRGGRDGSLWYYHRVLPLLGGRIPGALMDELQRCLEELEGLLDEHDDRPPAELMTLEQAPIRWRDV